MHNIQLFKFEDQKVRTMTINEEPYFVGKDVATILGYSNSRKALIDHVDDEDKRDGVTIRDAIGRNQAAVVINESGLYSLILSSKMPEAKKFKHWVTSEVLPAIRQHGAYLTDYKALDIITNKDGLAGLLKQAADQLEQKDIQIKRLEPKANYFDSQMRNPGLMTTTEIAKDYGWSATKLNQELYRRRVIYPQGSGHHKVWVLYRDHADQGYTQYEPYSYVSNGTKGMHNNLKWTQKGKKFIYDLLAKDGIRPTLERMDLLEEG